MGPEPLVHVLLVSFPGQGHVNPLLRLGKKLASKGLLVTFTASESIGKQMRKANGIGQDLTPVGEGFIRFEFFDDGLAEDEPRRMDCEYLPALEKAGWEAIPRMVNKYAEENRPVSCLINNPFIPWVSDVAESLGLPSAVLWVQSCASFTAYYHYYRKLVPFPSESAQDIDVQLPCMPLLKHDEIPSFLHPTTPYPFLREAILGQYKNLEKAFCVLMDTLQEAELEVIDHTSRICPIKAVGPLFKSRQAPSASVRGDFVKAEGGCIGWLDSKPLGSVVYISFGSVACLKQDQCEELALGLLESGVNFMWVLKQPDKNVVFKPVTLPEGFLEKAGDKGKLVEWSPQEQVLAHPSLACFITHCGWNSSIEALTSGVPVVAYPLWGDQVINAKYMVDVFKVGLRLARGEAEMVTRDVVAKCLLEATEGPKAAEIKENALKWKAAAEAAITEGGSSDQNIQDFVDEVKRRAIAIQSRTMGVVDDPVAKAITDGVGIASG
ncbi:hypothetical protein SAY86_003559 [Trapa natans]|uniref:Glycosyltransferase n=1 Tax=Trapa natans TaxID=22666 RepID=A0AAN7MED0_TRANT|nr:hypothetical protein SAY86_003559 [Trapa natans]